MRFITFVALIVTLSSCSISRYVNREVKKSEILSQQHTGLSIQPVGDTKSLVSFNDRQYFTPASNTKLFSLYAGLSSLGDSIPGLEYLEWGDILLIQGTGDPSFLHPDLPKSKIYDFLKSRKEQIFFTSHNFENKRFGPGWSWDDYNDYYQPELSPLPLYANIARFKGESSKKLKVAPDYWEHFLVKDTLTTGIVREEERNLFHYSKNGIQEGKVRDIPVKMSDRLLVQLLSDTLNREVKWIKIPLSVDLQTIYSIPSDSLYKLMMHVSDNLLAEQLMLLYASANKLPLNTTKAIEHFTRQNLGDLPDKPVWKDGSGLSRYNLFTPRSIVKLLQKIYVKVPEERLFELLPSGGQSGTLKGMFKKEEKPFIFAKTGSMSGVYNLSGYLITRKGKKLAFSFMNNNSPRPISEIKKEVERLLTEIHQRY